MDVVKKKIIVGYCAAIILSLLIVPWKIDSHTKYWSGKISQGYAFILSPPKYMSTIDFSVIFLEFIIITVGAIIIYVLRDHIFRKP